MLGFHIMSNCMPFFLVITGHCNGIILNAAIQIKMEQLMKERQNSRPMYIRHGSCIYITNYVSIPYSVC